jgi:signal recognition particle subunit SRP68
VPVKPLFLDVAWNYIDYPNRPGQQPAVAAPESASQMDVDEPEAAPVQEKKKGWFGFGR